MVKEEAKPVPTSSCRALQTVEIYFANYRAFSPSLHPSFSSSFFFYILKRVREREREREDSTIRVTNERTNDAINLLTILKCLISVFRFT